jgi:hypothetical protein
LLLEALMRMLMFAIVEPDVCCSGWWKAGSFGFAQDKLFVMPRMTILNVVTIP